MNKLLLAACLAAAGTNAAEKQDKQLQLHSEESLIYKTGYKLVERYIKGDSHVTNAPEIKKAIAFKGIMGACQEIQRIDKNKSIIILFEGIEAARVSQDNQSAQELRTIYNDYLATTKKKNPYASPCSSQETARPSINTTYEAAFDFITRDCDYNEIQRNFTILDQASQNGMWNAYHFVRRTTDDTTMTTFQEAYNRALKCNDKTSVQKFENYLKLISSQKL